MVGGYNIIVLIKGYESILRYVNNEFSYFYRKYKSQEDVKFKVINIESSFDDYSKTFMKNVSKKITNDNIYLIKKYGKLDLNIIVKRYSSTVDVKKIININNYLYGKYLKRSQMICVLLTVYYDNNYYIFCHVNQSIYLKYDETNRIHSFLKSSLEAESEITLRNDQIWFTKSHIRNILMNGKNVPTSITPFIIYL